MSDFGKFASAVGKKKFSKVYLIYGTEDYFTSRAVNLLIETAVDPANRSFNLDVLDGTETTSEEVLSSALSFPLVGERRLTVVRRYDKMERKQRVDVADHLGDLPDTNIICLAAGEIKVSEDPYKKISSVAETLAFNRLKGEELTEFLVKSAGEMGKELKPGNADFLVDLAGDSIGDLVSELEKLVLFVGEKKEIEFEDISTAVGKSRTFNIFELQRVVGQRNVNEAQEIAGRMLEAGEKPVYINFMLTRYFLSLLQVKHLARKGLDQNEISSRVFGRWNPYLKEYIGAASLYSVADLKRAAAVLLETDVKLKSSGYRDADAIAMVISEIVGKSVQPKPRRIISS